ncbi:carboxylesterase family protein [Saccharothrix violaceirubra]
MLAILTATVAPARPGPEVTTDGGTVRGSRTGQVESYRGIPYAQAPVGALRWHPPLPARPWSGVRDATASGSPCAQTILPTGSAEDCLYLDVTTPRGTGRPVLVWLHGGGNTMGSGADIDPARLAARGVVVVTINYRLGVFGFFGHPGLAGSGTFGLQDQQAALRWVRANAAAFGGDPRVVTLAGQSAGAVDVCGQLTSPGAAGLFHRVIMQSGSCRTGQPTYGADGEVRVGVGGFWAPVADRERSGAAVAAELGCGDVDCLRGRSTEELLRHEAGFGPAYGTPTLPENPVTAVAAGRVHRVPVLSGNTRDEARLTTMYAELPLGRTLTAQEYAEALRVAFGADRAAAVLREYPAGADAGAALSALDTDRVFACPQLRTGRDLARFTPVHAYEFADPDAPTSSMYFGQRPAGASHGSELAYVFDLRVGPYAGLTPTSLTPRQRALSDTMIDNWAGFVRTGTVPWRSVRSYAPDRIGSVDGWTAHRCSFWSD